MTVPSINIRISVYVYVILLVRSISWAYTYVTRSYSSLSDVQYQVQRHGLNGIAGSSVLYFYLKLAMTQNIIKHYLYSPNAEVSKGPWDDHE